MKTIVHPWVRYLAAMIFLISGSGNLFAFKDTAARLGALGFSSPTFLLACAIAIEIAAGAILFLTLKPRRRRARSSF